MSPRGGGILRYTCYLGSVHRLTHLGRYTCAGPRADPGGNARAGNREPDLGGAQGPDAVHRYRYVINSKHSNLAVEICDFTFLDSARHKVTTETTAQRTPLPGPARRIDSAEHSGDTRRLTNQIVETVHQEYAARSPPLRSQCPIPLTYTRTRRNASAIGHKAKLRSCGIGRRRRMPECQAPPSNFSLLLQCTLGDLCCYPLTLIHASCLRRLAGPHIPCMATAGTPEVAPVDL